MAGKLVRLGSLACSFAVNCTVALNTYTPPRSPRFIGHGLLDSDAAERLGSLIPACEKQVCLADVSVRVL